MVYIYLNIPAEERRLSLRNSIAVSCLGMQLVYMYELLLMYIIEDPGVAQYGIKCSGNVFNFRMRDAFEIIAYLDLDIPTVCRLEAFRNMYVHNGSLLSETLFCKLLNGNGSLEIARIANKLGLQLDFSKPL